MTIPQPSDGQPGPVTLATVLGALNATVGELKATKAEVADLKGEAQFLRTYGHTNRLLIWAAVVGLTLDIAASAVAGYALASLHHEQIQARRNAATISQLHDNNLAACRYNNIRLGKQEKALDAILQQVPPQNAAERAIITKDLGYVMAGWVPRQCAKAYPLPPSH